MRISGLKSVGKEGLATFLRLRKETRSNLRLKRECAAALELYIFEADKLCDMLRCSIDQPETVTEHDALISQRDSEGRAHTEYLRARKLLLHAVHLSCPTQTSYRMSRQVSAELEAQWKLALEQVAALEARVSAMEEGPAPLSDEQSSELTALGDHVMALWNHPNAPVQMKKRILRTVLNEIVVESKRDSSTSLLLLHWARGVHTKLQSSVQTGRVSDNR